MLSKKGEKLINLFDYSAQSWGWQIDQGVGRKVNQSKKLYENSRKSIENYIILLESKIKKFQKSKKGV